MDHEMQYETAWQQLSDFARAIVEAMGQDINGFDTDDWPENVAPAVKQLTAALAAERALADDLAQKLHGALYHRSDYLEAQHRQLAAYRAARTGGE